MFMVFDETTSKILDQYTELLSNPGFHSRLDDIGKDNEPWLSQMGHDFSRGVWSTDHISSQMQLVGEGKEQTTYKVVILGDSRVGRTSIITRQMLGYQPTIQNPTIGCHCSEIHVVFDNRDTTLQVWDTACQEMYRALVPVYLRGANAVILVYDVTDHASFTSLSHWYEVLVDVVPTGTSIYIVGNKIDLADDALIDDAQAIQFSKVHNAMFFKVSALSGAGLDALFEAIARKLSEGTEVQKIDSGLRNRERSGGKECGC
jgi:small GTP-binding protein